jgi:two-component system response regulator (stage 0 sporulation protein A)
MSNTKQETLYHALFLARHLSGADLQDGLVYILYELDMPAHNIGYHYIRNAILLFYRDPVHMLLQGIYQTVIEKVKPVASYDQIEQSMRKVIGLAYKNRDPQVWNLYFHSTGIRPSKRPSNLEFISNISSFMELWQACCKEVSYEN